MSDFDRNAAAAQYGAPLTRAEAAVVDEGLRAYMLRIYNYMVLGLAITGFAALGIYMLSAFMAGLAGVLEASWLGGVTTNLGQSMELSVIAAAVIGGADLMGGSGTILGAVVGAALIEIIRNSLTLIGISTFWQGAFVGSFIVLAVAFDSVRRGRRNAGG